MTIKELYAQLQTLNCPIAYYQFSKRVEPPFLIYFRNGTENFVADDKVYKGVSNIQLELYTNNKSFDIETKIDNLLASLNISFDKEDDYIETEKMYLTSYSFQIVEEKEAN